MTREEFLDACAVLVGPGNGMLVRAASQFGFSVNTMYPINAGKRPVPERYAVAVRAALAKADRLGGLVGVVAPRLERAVREVEATGVGREAVVIAVAAWAALQFVVGRP